MSVHKVATGWEVRWRQGGRQRSRTFPRGHKGEADDFDREIKRRRRLGGLTELDAGKRLLHDFAPEWRFRAAENRLARSTLDRYDQVWDVHVLPRLGHYALRELTTGLIEDELLAPMEAARVGRATQLKALYIVQAVLRYAVRRQLIPYNPAEQVERPRKRKRAVRPIAPVAVERMLSLLGPRDAMLVELLGYQGLRPGEALALTDIEVRERTLLVEAAIAVGEEKDTKTQKIRTVKLLGPVVPQLAEYQLATRKERLELGTELLFPRPDGEPWRATDYRNWRRRVFRPAAVAAGIATVTVERLPGGRERRRYKGPRPYDLRHTFVSLLIQEGRQLAYVADQAGHSVEECARTYTHLFEEYRDAKPAPAEDLIRRARTDVHDERNSQLVFGECSEPAS
jgi:integrase